MTKFELEISDDQVTDAITRWVGLGNDPHPLLEAFGNSLEKNIKLCFARSTDPYGRPWASLKVRDGMPLQDSGHFRDSFTHFVDGDSAVAGTNAIQAAIQNFGGTIVPKEAKALRFMVGGHPVFAQKVTIPARPVIPNQAEGLPKDWTDDLLFILQAKIGGDISD